MLGFSQSSEVVRARNLIGGSAHVQSRGAQGAESAFHLSRLSAFNTVLQLSGVAPGELRIAAFKLMLPCLLAGALLILVAPLLSVLLPPAYLLGLYVWLRVKRFKRAEAFEKDYVAFLLSLASAVRAGQDPIVALIEARGLFPPPSVLGSIIKTFGENIEQGLSEEQSVARFALTVDHPDIKLFRTAFVLARKEGSSLGGCLQRLARVTRQRQSFRRKIRSALAMQKLSAVGIALCAVAIGCVQWVSNPKVMLDTLAHPIGFKVMLGGLALVSCGLGWMLNLTRQRI